MYKVLFIGAKGLLGSNFIDRYSKENSIHGTYFKNKNVKKIKNLKSSFLDIRNKKNVFELIKNSQAGTVIHASAIGDVDFCEKNKRIAHQTNVSGTKNVADACNKYQKKIIFLSSNAIYDGKKSSLSEKSKPNPINFYGSTKLKGEKYVSSVCGMYMILRLNTMYGWNEYGERDNPATWIIEKVKNGKSISVVDDVYNNHLYVLSAAEVVNEVIINWQNRQFFNIAGKDCVSRYDFARIITKILKKKQSLVKRVNSSYFQSLAPRPKNTCYNTKKMEQRLKSRPYSLKTGLEHMIKNNPNT